MNVEEIKAMRISRQQSSVQILIYKKQIEDVEYFKCLGSMITNYVRSTSEIKSKTAMAKVTFYKKKNLFTSKLDLNLKKKLLSAAFGALLCMALKVGHFGKEIKNTWEFLKMCRRRRLVEDHL
jgi:hypothetical protein